MTNMRCIRCKKDADVILPHLSACNSCFCRIIEKRIRKQMRVNELFSKGETVHILDDQSAASAIISSLLPEVLSYKRIEFIICEKIPNNAAKAVLPWTLDDELNSALKSIFLGDEMIYPAKRFDPAIQTVMPLISVTREEIERYADINGLKFTETEDTEPLLSFRGMFRQHPEIPFNFFKNIQRLKYI